RELVLMGRDELRVHEDKPGYPLLWRIEFEPEWQFHRPLEFERDGVTSCVLRSHEYGQSFVLDAEGRCVACLDFYPAAFESVEWKGTERVLVGAYRAPSGAIEPVFIVDM
ncbi:MAG: hypothetical protein ACI841_002618, partial [Planctomycetota bacterium]